MAAFSNSRSPDAHSGPTKFLSRGRRFVGPAIGLPTALCQFIDQKEVAAVRVAARRRNGLHRPVGQPTDRTCHKRIPPVTPPAPMATPNSQTNMIRGVFRTGLTQAHCPLSKSTDVAETANEQRTATDGSMPRCGAPIIDNEIERRGGSRRAASHCPKQCPNRRSCPIRPSLTTSYATCGPSRTSR